MRRPGLRQLPLLLLPLLLLAPDCLAHFNLYLASSEVAALLGVQGELWLVREGVPLAGALAFELPVPAGVPQLQLTWHALPGAGTGVDLPYSLHVAARPPGAARLAAPARGLVPAQPAAWRVLLPCTAPTDTALYISLNVTLPAPAAPLELALRWRKLCPREPGAGGGYVAAVGAGRAEPGAGQTPRAAHILYAGAACMAAALLLGGGAAAACRARHHEAGPRARARPRAPLEPFLAAADSVKSGASYASCGSDAGRGEGGPAPGEGEGSAELQARLRELTVSRGLVRLRVLLHEGTYGRVYLGACACACPQREHEHEQEHEVLVKTVGAAAREAQVSRLLREGCALWGCGGAAAGVLALHGVALAEAEGEAPLLLYGPAPPPHNLKRWLQAGAGGAAGAGALGSPRQARLVLQAARALAHLHERRLLHGDVAARNCLVDDHDNLQLADNGLARDLFPGDYDCLGDNDIRPVRWLPPEALRGGAAGAAGTWAGAGTAAGTVGADAWALGVLGWEVCARARLPYGEVEAGELGGALAAGLRLARPPTCPPPLYAALAACWAAAPARRPPPARLAAYLAAFLRQLDSYV